MTAKTLITANVVNEHINQTAAPKEHVHDIYVKTSDLKTLMLNMCYPIGSIYTSVNKKNPSELFGGTWEQIVDKFLYCTSSSGEVGGSKKISVENLPSHNHTATCSDIYAKFNGIPRTSDIFYGSASSTWTGEFKYASGLNTLRTDNIKISQELTVTVNNTGSGTDYMPPFMTVYAWKRTA